ncbi:HlyD family secretion protein, partial [Candidatus Latescibacterota bacterium]
LATVVFVFSYPGKIPYSVKVVGRVLPSKQWIVNRDQNGQFSAILYDHLYEAVESYLFTEFERGDPVRFRIHPSIISGAQITRGDTVAWINSSELEREIVRLSGELRTQKALLRMAETGEKESLVEEAKKQIEHARSEYEEQQKIVERQKQLFETKFIPYQDYEIALSTLKLFSVNIEIAEAQLRTVQTGVKQEEIRMISSHITALEHEIETLLDRKENYTITSPITGMVLDTSVMDTAVLDANARENLVNISDISTYIVIIPMQLRVIEHVFTGQQVEFEIQGIRSPNKGIIARLGNVVRIMRDEQVIIATASLEGNGEPLLPGTVARCSIICEPITLYEYLFRAITAVFNR